MNPYKYIDEGRKHMHTLNGNPIVGGSTMKSIIGDKGALFQWYADMAAVAGLALPIQDIKAEYDAAQGLKDKVEKSRAKKALDEKYPNYALARKAAMLHRDSKAVEGSLMHGELESYIQDCIIAHKVLANKTTGEESKPLYNFVEWAQDNVREFHFTEAYCYHPNLGSIPVGGIADIGLTLKDGRKLVGDHKSAKEAYPDMFLQCAIYDVLLSYSGGLDRDGSKIFDWQPADGYVIFPFGSKPFTPEFRWNADEFRQGAEDTARLYKLTELQ